MIYHCRDTCEYWCWQCESIPFVIFHSQEQMDVFAPRILPHQCCWVGGISEHSQINDTMENSTLLTKSKVSLWETWSLTFMSKYPSPRMPVLGGDFPSVPFSPPLALLFSTQEYLTAYRSVHTNCDVRSVMSAVLFFKWTQSFTHRLRCDSCVIKERFSRCPRSS